MQAEESVDALAFLQGNRIRIRVTNTGPIQISVVRVWLNETILWEDVSLGIGDTREIETGQYVGEGECFRVQLTTDRGNFIVPKGSPVRRPVGGGLAGYPYALQIVVLNLAPDIVGSATGPNMLNYTFLVFRVVDILACAPDYADHNSGKPPNGVQPFFVAYALNTPQAACGAEVDTYVVYIHIEGIPGSGGKTIDLWASKWPDYATVSVPNSLLLTFDYSSGCFVDYTKVKK